MSIAPAWFDHAAKRFEYEQQQGTMMGNANMATEQNALRMSTDTGLVD